MTHNSLVSLEEAKGIWTAVIEKAPVRPAPSQGARWTGAPEVGPNGATLIVFSDSLDKALASFVLANGAAASGKKVTMFFTFWGLSVLKRREPVRVPKDLMGRMFGWMLPSHAGRLSLSKLNFGGMGRLMMVGRMRSQKVDMLEDMIAAARVAGVRFIACQMSMDIMGVKREELVEGVEIGGVATYMEAATGSGVNLFL